MKSATYTDSLKSDKTFLSVMIHASAEKYHFDAMFLRLQLRKPMREQNAFHVMYVPPISKLEPMKYIYPEAVMNASDYIETEYSDVSIFMQYCASIRHIQ